MSKITEAIEKITEEVNKTDDEVIQYIGESLIDTITDLTAEKILIPGKTVAAAYNKMYELAKKEQKNGKAGFSPRRGMEIVEEYFCITPEDKKAGATITKITPPPARSMNINLLDLM